MVTLSQTTAADACTLRGSETKVMLAGSWFGSLDSPIQAEFIRNSSLWRISAGRVVIAEGSVPATWFGIATGVVKLTKVSAEGRETILDLVEPGQWFGDQPLLAAKPQPYTAETLTESTLLLMRKSSLLKIQSSHPQLASDLARLNWCHASRMIDHLQWRGEPSILARTRRHLELLAQRFGNPNNEGVLIDLRLTQRQLADLIDSSRQRVNVSLKTLERRGEIRQLGGHILLLRPVTRQCSDKMAPAQSRSRERGSTPTA